MAFLKSSKLAIEIFLTECLSALTLGISELCKQLVVLIKIMGVQWFLLLYVVFNVFAIVVISLILDPASTIVAVKDVVNLLLLAMSAVWNACTNPKLLLAYGFFMASVYFSREFPRTIREALINAQNEH